MDEIEGVSTQTWVDRFTLKHREVGPEQPGHTAREHATSSMLDEIHLMLRKICAKLGVS